MCYYMGHRWLYYKDKKIKTEGKITFKEDMPWDLVAKSNGFFKNLRRSGCIMEKE